MIFFSLLLHPNDHHLNWSSSVCCNSRLLEGKFRSALLGLRRGGEVVFVEVVVLVILPFVVMVAVFDVGTVYLRDVAQFLLQ